MRLGFAVGVAGAVSVSLFGFSNSARAAGAGTLYGSTAAGGPGELYILNPANGALVQDVGPLHDAGQTNYPITGLAFNPLTGVLYGSTGNNPAATSALLVTIDPATALVTVIGTFNTGQVNTGGTAATMADLAFDSAGNLFGVGSIGGPQLYSINLATAQATVIGSTGLTSTTGGGLEFTGSGLFGTPTSSRFGTYNVGTGTYTDITNPTKPLGGAYAALTTDGVSLFGLDLGPGPTVLTELVTISPTGTVIDLGPSVTALDAIAFSIVPEPATAGVVLLAVAAALPRRRKTCAAN